MTEIPLSLDPFFLPRSIAVIGATDKPGSVGDTLFRNLLANPFGGPVFPVNPKRSSIHGVPCYPAVGSLPQAVDLAVVVTPAATVPGVVRECVQHRIKAAIVISAGFSELGDEGRKLERELREVAHGKIRLVGPNCLGIIHPPSNLNASFAASMARRGKVALISQSGAICTAILDWARETNVGFSSFVSVGSALDVDFADLIDYFGDEPNTRSIILYMESLGNVRRFLSAARNVARTKPIVVVKSGRHEAGARAAASHTGALAGADAVFEAAFRRAGILRVQTIRDLFHMSEVLDMQPQPAGPALAIITNAGGPGVMTIDALMLAGGQAASLAPKTLQALNEALPPFWSHGNPIDLLGDAGPERYARAVAACAADEGIQGILVLLTPQAMSDPTETARRLVPYARLPGKPILACWMGGPSVRPGREILTAADIPTFDAPESAVRTFLHMIQYRRNQELLYESPPAGPVEGHPDEERVKSILAGVRTSGRTLLTEVESKEVLTAYGIPTTASIPANTPEEAVAVAARIGFPVAMKLHSEVVTHKSDVGGVQLNLPSAVAVREAFAAIQRNLAAHRPDVPFTGVNVQPMIDAKGYELIVGSSVDRQFGPVILFGAGGILVEVFQDRSLALPPLNRTLARRLIERTRIHEALKGVRGRKPISFEDLETLLVRFSKLVVDFHDQIREIDINPLLASSERLVALDARIILLPADLPADLRPRLAIHPYPDLLIGSFRLEDDTEVTVRPIRPEDESLLVDFHAGMSEHTIRMRFFSLVKRLTRENLIRLCHLDYERAMALVAVTTVNGKERILGVSRYFLDPETFDAEFAIVVGDAWQGHGLGRHLLRRLMDIARERGIRRLVGLVLRENTPMLGLCEELGFQCRDSAEMDAVEAVRNLN